MDGTFRRRNLPHLIVPGGTYFVTFCLAGSLCACGYHAIARRWRQRADAIPPPGMSTADWERRCSAAMFQEVDRALDGMPAAQWLADPRLAAVVEAALRHWDGVQYRLIAHVVMPNHCHVVLDMSISTGGQGATAVLEDVVRSIKRHSAVVCNRILGRRGAMWQAESYDRVVRNADELERVVRYVEWNPVKAGLCRRPEEWRFSSARRAEEVAG